MRMMTEHVYEIDLAPGRRFRISFRWRPSEWGNARMDLIVRGANGPFPEGAYTLSVIGPLRIQWTRKLTAKEIDAGERFRVRR